ncbi:alpha/beta hydrolase [SAR202 cluster bacterium AD-804-J14_MRT_500m]|nr:alpha/beta hydrolase [SAR202 cluster bacterium AD-804-J14_MRT_500m]
MLVSGPSEQFIEINGLRFRYLDWGSNGKPPMICIHGHTGQAHVWDRFGQVFARHFHVYSIDQRGHGGTQWAPGDYDRDRYVEDLAGFIDVLGLQKVVLVGHSMGGWHSLLYTVTHQDIVASIIMLDIAPERSAESHKEVLTRPATPLELEDLKEVVDWLRLRDPWASDEAIRKDAEDKTITSPDGKRVWKADPELFGTAPLTAELTARYWESLKSINSPILHVRGTESLFVSDDLVARMELTNPLFTNVDVFGAGHDVHIDKPDELEDIVRRFLKLDI